MSIWYFGSPELPDRSIIKERAIIAGSKVAAATVVIGYELLDIQRDINPVVRFALEHGLDELFDKVTTDNTDELAGRQYREGQESSVNQ